MKTSAILFALFLLGCSSQDDAIAPDTSSVSVSITPPGNGVAVCELRQEKIGQPIAIYDDHAGATFYNWEYAGGSLLIINDCTAVFTPMDSTAMVSVCVIYSAIQ